MYGNILGTVEGIEVSRIFKANDYENALEELYLYNEDAVNRGESSVTVVMDVFRFDEEPYALIHLSAYGTYTITNLKIVSNLDEIASMSMAGRLPEEVFSTFKDSFVLGKRYTGRVEDVFEAIRRLGKTTYEVTGASYPTLDYWMDISDFYGLVLEVEYA